MKKKLTKPDKKDPQPLPETSVVPTKPELPIKKTTDPLYPLNEMECPWCRIPFKGYERNKNEKCQECGQGYIVIKVKREFFVLT